MNTIFRTLTVLFSLVSISAHAGISIIPSLSDTYFHDETSGPFTAVAVDPLLTVSGDASTVTGVNITMPADPAAVLAFTNDAATMGNIAGSFNAATGTLSLSSTGSAATTAQWQSALRSVTYNRSSAANPSSAVLSVNFLAIDGTPNNTAERKSLVLVGGVAFVQPSMSWGLCENSSGNDLGLFLEASTYSNNKTMTWSVVKGPLHGSVAFNGQLSYNGVNEQPLMAKYTPDADYTGSDSVVFSVTDGIIAPQITLTLTMAPPPPPPGAIIGQDIDTVGPNYIRYSFEGPIDSNAVYKWSYTGQNVFIGNLSGDANEADLNFYPYPTATDGVLSVVASTVCGNSAASTKAISVRPIQSVTFDSIPEKVYRDPDFGLHARSSSQLTVRFVIADTNVATQTTDWSGALQVHIRNAGQTTITAYQDGQGGLQAAPPVTRVLVVKKADQYINFALPYIYILGQDIPPTLSAAATSGLPVQYESSDPRVAQVAGSELTVLDTGTVMITATQSGNNNYNPAQARATMIVKKPTPPPTVASVFPNPAHQFFYCQPDYQFAAKSYALYSGSGRVVASVDHIYYLGSFLVDASNFQPGFYVLKVFGKRGGKDATLQLRVLIF